MSQSFIEITPRTESEKMAIITQNLLITEYFKSCFQMIPYDISRDKEGHIVVLYCEKDDINAFTIGINNETKKITIFHAGKISLDTYNSDRTGMIDIVGIHPAFMKKGLGTILLQSAENFFKADGKKEIQLDALHHYEDMSSEHKSLEEVLMTMQTTEAEKYLEKNFCDLNMYLYSTMGYVKLGEGTRYATIMKKNKLQEIKLAYGLSRPLTVSQSKRQFPISLAFHDIILTAKHGQQRNLFVNSFNYIKSENFSPFKFNPTIQDLKYFYEIATRIESERLYKNQIYHCENYPNTHSEKYSNLQKLYQKTKEFSNIKNKELDSFYDLYERCKSALERIQESEPGK